jgi:hypothetical protein
MGSGGLCKRHKNGDKDYFDTGDGESMIYSQTYKGQEDSQGVALTCGVQPAIKIWEA